MKIQPRLGSAGQDRSTWLALLFLVVGVIAPTTCVLWFMRDAARAQADAARQSVAEAYRGQLRFMRDKTDAYWQGRAAALQRSIGKGGPADFANALKAGLADSLILPNYPAFARIPVADPAAERADWRAALAFEERHNRLAAIGAWAAIAKSDVDPSTAARAAQAQIRLLTGEKEAAIKAIDDYFARGRIARVTDLQGRLIAADEQLLALHLLPPRDARRAVVLHRLVAMLNDYDTTRMPAAQRLFLMDEVQAIDRNAAFPTYGAEHLAAQFLEADDSRAGGPALQPTRVPDVWRLTAKNGRVTALYRTATILAAMRGILDDGGKGVRFAAVPPGMPSGGDAIAAGGMLPGWQLSISVVDPRLVEDAARGRMASYLWAGYLVIGAMAITGLFVGQSFRKQMRLARLKTDLVAAVSHELKTPLSSMRLLVDSLLADTEFDAKKTREYLQLVAGENLRLTRLVENFLTFSRIERNRQRFEFEQIEPADIVASAAAVMRERLNDLNVDVEPGLPAIQADPDALLTALVNLLDNAWKYTRAEKRICLRARREAGQVVFAVEDNGIGIAAREQKRIFRRFYQVDARLARETGGCGLGLTIVDSIARAHGGSVRVASQVGAGSTFSLCLPV
jgi:signal transduction histidine kinase